MSSDEEESSPKANRKRPAVKLSSPEAREKLGEILDTNNLHSLSKAELELAYETLSSCANECESLLNGKRFKLDEMKEWEENWTQTLQEEVSENKAPYTPDEIQDLVKEVSKAIVTPPRHILYEVPGKHGSVILYELFSFETLEANGKRQKILAERYQFLSGYDEKEPWSLTSRKTIKEGCSFQQHLKNIEAFRVPDDLPSDAENEGLFWVEFEGVGYAAFNQKIEESIGDYLKLDQVLKTRKIWQIVLGMTSFES